MSNEDDSSERDRLAKLAMHRRLQQDRHNIVRDAIRRAARPVDAPLAPQIIRSALQPQMMGLPPQPSIRQGSTISAPPPLASFAEFTLKSLLEFGDNVDDGRLVEAVSTSWFEILEVIRRDPARAHEIDPRKWEEILAGAYEREGFDVVILTPRSGDGGRDVIASKHGVGSIRIYDQMKAYKPGRVVTADEVRSMLGILHGNVSKGVVTTTSTFAPELMKDKAIAQHVPFRLELKDRNDLFAWLEALAKRERG